MTQLHWIITSIILVIYAIVLYYITGKNRDADKLIWAFGMVAIAGFVIHMVLFDEVTSDGFTEFDDRISRIVFSIQYSLEMFIANTIIFKGEVMDALKDHPIIFFIYMPVYGMALMTSGFAIFHFLPRRLHNWIWLTCHMKRPDNRKSHIFIGINSQSLYLANDILTNSSRDEIIFIDIPQKQDYPQGISIWDIIARFFKESKGADKLGDYVVLKAGKGLNRLTRWFKEKDTSIYILTDNQKFNLQVLEKIWEHKDKFECRIYCHAKKEGLTARYDSITDVKDRIRFIDSSYLAVEYLKKDDSCHMLPVNFVDIAEDPETKRRLGYVKSAFTCAVIGFGETGKEAVKFLYEFGAFPDRSNKKAPFKCHIFDSNIEREACKFGICLDSLKSTAASENEFELHDCKIESTEFMSKISSIIHDLNYVFVCLGDDDLNLETAINIAECAVISKKDTGRNLCIAIKQTMTNRLIEDTLKNANHAYKQCLHPFGMLETIWKLDIINNESLEAQARHFYDSYTKMSKELDLKEYQSWNPKSWEDRLKESHSQNYKERCKARRQIMQDYSNCLHIHTKHLLCLPNAGLGKMILDVNNKDKHCDIKGQGTQNGFTEVLEHLAVCEHLRWEASHLMSGYRFGENTDDEKKCHDSIKPFHQLTDGKQHYDWLVVKNSIS